MTKPAAVGYRVVRMRASRRTEWWRFAFVFPLLAILAILAYASVALGAFSPVIGPGNEQVVVDLVRPVLRQNGFETNVSLSVEGGTIRVPLRGKGLPFAASLAIGHGDSETPAGMRELAPGIALGCPDCSPTQLKSLETLGAQMAQARDRVEGRLWKIPSGYGPDDTRYIFESSAKRRPWVAGGLALWLFLSAALGIGTVLVREMRRDLALLGGSLLLGAALRVFVANRQLMSVNSYGRDLPWLWHLKEHGVPVLGLFPDGLDGFQQIAAANLVLSSIVPLVGYAHARLVFADSKIAGWSAFLLAICPMAVAFSKSEVLFVSSMVFGSITLLLVQRVFAARKPLHGWLWGVSAVGWLWCAIDARPLSVLLVVVLVPALRVYDAESPHRLRRALLVLGSLGIAAATTMEMFTLGRASVAPGASSEPPGLMDLVMIFTEAQRALVANNYWRPGLMPLWMSACGLVGMVALWRDSRRRFFYVFGWFAVIFVAHFLVHAENPVIAARYGLHSLIPFIFMVAYGLNWLLHEVREPWHTAAWQRPAAWGAAFVAVVGTTIPALAFLAPLHDDANAEYAFLEELWQRGAPEPGSVVLERYDDRESPRYLQIGVRTQAGEERRLVTPHMAMPAGEHRVYFYAGLPCIWHREGHARWSVACQKLYDSAHWKLVAERAIDAPVHDKRDARRRPRGDRVGLYELVPLAEEAR